MTEILADPKSDDARDLPLHMRDAVFTISAQLRVDVDHKAHSVANLRNGYELKELLMLELAIRI